MLPACAGPRLGSACCGPSAMTEHQRPTVNQNEARQTRGAPPCRGAPPPGKEYQPRMTVDESRSHGSARTPVFLGSREHRWRAACRALPADPLPTLAVQMDRRDPRTLAKASGPPHLRKGRRERRWPRGARPRGAAQSVRSRQLIVRIGQRGGGVGGGRSTATRRRCLPLGALTVSLCRGARVERGGPGRLRGRGPRREATQAPPAARPLAARGLRWKTRGGGSTANLVTAEDMPSPPTSCPSA